MRRSLLMALSFGLVLVAPVGAQEGGAPSAAAPERPPIGPACQADALREFDFWLGEWRVTNAAGQEVGRNHITQVSDGCALLEEWTAAGGGTGTSLNTYDPATGHWNQYWVGGGGTRLHLEGGLDGESMSMSGRRMTNNGEIIDRITWTPLPDGRVEQRWDQSSDGGETWTTGFQGFYERSAAKASAGADAGASPATGTGPTACVNEQAHGFDFWAGTWKVESRRRDAAGTWQESTNRWRAETVLGGCAFVDYANGDFGTGRLRGMGTRYYDPAADRWYITWMSTEQPGAFETWEGSFEDDGTAEFFTQIETPNGGLLSRIRWWDIEEDSAEWEHAISRDDGDTWIPTWRMTLSRSS